MALRGAAWLVSKFGSRSRDPIEEADDATIWDYVAQHGFAIVTKDADFRQRSFLLGHPPKVVWLRLGNCSTKAIEALLRSRARDVEEFLADEQKSFLGLY